MTLDQYDARPPDALCGRQREAGSLFDAGLAPKVRADFRALTVPSLVVTECRIVVQPAMMRNCAMSLRLYPVAQINGFVSIISYVAGNLSLINAGMI